MPALEKITISPGLTFDALVSGALQYQVWDLTDAVIEGRGDRAMAVLRAMDARDHPRQLLIYMLTRQYRPRAIARWRPISAVTRRARGRTRATPPIIISTG